MLSVIVELLTYINVRSFHWILLAIEVDAGTVEVYDPLRRDFSDYAIAFESLQR